MNITEEMKLAGFQAYQKAYQGFAPTGLDCAEACFNAMLFAAPTPPEVEPVGKVTKEFNIDNMFDRMGAEYFDVEKINEGDLLYTSPPSPKASWDADGNPLNLEAAAQRAADVLECYNKREANNLRKFLDKP